jgi:hypothetical protein
MIGFGRIRMFNGFEVHNIHILAHIKIKIGHKYRHHCSITNTFLFLANKTNSI